MTYSVFSLLIFHAYKKSICIDIPVFVSITLNLFYTYKPVLKESAISEERFSLSSNMVSNEQAPAGDYQDNDYVSRTGQSTIPVQRDEAPVEGSPYDGETADSDQQLGTCYMASSLNVGLLTLCAERDEADAIDRSNIIESRTRGATKEAGTYAEPGDDEGLLGPEDGTSATR